MFGPVDDQPVIVAEAPGEPPDADQRIRVVLDPDDPTKSVAIVPHPGVPGQVEHPPADAGGDAPTDGTLPPS